MHTQLRKRIRINRLEYLRQARALERSKKQLVEFYQRHAPEIVEQTLRLEKSKRQLAETFQRLAPELIKASQQMADLKERYFRTIG